MTKKNTSTHGLPGKQETKPLLLHQLPFLSLALAAANQRIPQKFYEQRYIFHGEKLEKTGLLSAKFCKLQEIAHIQQENFPLAFLIMNKTKVPGRNQSIIAKHTGV